MQTRLLGSTDLNLSVVGLGTWAIGGGEWAFGWGDQDDDQAIAAIKRAVDVGVNWIDTAAVYGLGKSETLVGKAVAELPVGDRPLIATKCGRTNAGDGQIGKSLQRASVIAECEASLKRLQVDCIDLYQMHWPQPDEEIEEGWETLVDLKKQGKVRHIGVSNHDVSQLLRLQSIHPVASLQPPYSMISADVENEIMPFCGENKIGVVPHSDSGAFTILWQDDHGGLEIQNKNGEWVGALPMPDTFVVNLGNIMQYWSNGRFSSTPHRVINRAGTDRYSIPLFVNPNHEVIIEPLVDLENKTFTPFVYGEYQRELWRRTFPVAKMRNI